MKKTFITFFILLFFLGAVFYIGWVQYKVAPDSCGIIITKIHGIKDEPVKPGKFYWNWEFLLPTNAQVKQFKIQPVNITKTITGNLPSGDVYSAIYDLNNSFNYKFTFSMSISISPEQLVELYRQNKITDDKNLEEYLSFAGDDIAQATASYYLKKLSENPRLTLESLRRDDLIKSIQIYKEVPEIDIYLLSLTESIIPDFDLYNRVRNKYMNENINQNHLKITDTQTSDTVAEETL